MRDANELLKSGRGGLILIPTPLGPFSTLDPRSFSILQVACEMMPNQAGILIETPKEGRANWVRFGLPREKIPDLLSYNEQTAVELNLKIIEEMRNGKIYCLLSDGGLPAFMDPGTELVDLCHQQKIPVSLANFDNSVLAALAISGLKTESFCFHGRLPRETKERETALTELCQRKETLVILDAPYRLPKLIELLQQIDLKHGKDRRSNPIIFAVFNLQHPSGQYLKLPLHQINPNQAPWNEKLESILVISWAG